MPVLLVETYWPSTGNGGEEEEEEDLSLASHTVHAGQVGEIIFRHLQIFRCGLSHRLV